MELNIADLFEAVVDTVADLDDGREALVCASVDGPGVRSTYAQLEARANQMAHALVAAGVGRDDHVGLHLHNGPEFVESMLACFKVRAVPVNVNYRYVIDELRYQFADAELVAVVTEPALAPMVESVAAELPALTTIIATGDAYEAFLDQGSTDRPSVGPRSADDRYLLYTGGTTGMPKGVVWRQEDIFFASLGGRGTPSRGVPALAQADDIVERVRKGDPIMCRLPLCPLIHGGGMWVALQTLLNGGQLVLDTSRHFEAEHALALLAEEHVELIMLIGDATARPIADALAADRAKRGESGYDLSRLQVIASGGAVLSAAVRALLRELLPGTAVIDTYGASETGGQGRLAASDGADRPRLVTDEHTAVLDAELRPVGPGEVGRLARSGWVPLGYWHDEARTAATFPVIDGVRWSLPGDLARLETDGTVTVLGRGSTSINTGGEKVFPEEVENVLKGHPAVFDALVVGLPHERFGEEVVAVVALRPSGDEDDERGEDDEDGAGGPSDGELATHARQHLAGYKVPRRWVRVDRCHRLPTGKPDYRWAREIAEARS